LKSQVEIKSIKLLPLKEVLLEVVQGFVDSGFISTFFSIHATSFCLPVVFVVF